MQAITTGVSRRLPCRAAVLVPLLLLGPHTNAVAGKWTITPDITVTGTYTDNASLAALPERGTFVTRIAPGIHIAGRGGRFTGNLDYSASALLYSNDVARNRVANTLDARGTLEAIEQFFFVDAFGSIGESFVSPFAPRPREIFSATANRVESRSYGLSPYIRGHVGNAFSYQLRYQDTWTNTNNSTLADIQTSEWTGRVESPIRLFGWALDYDDNTITYNNYSAGSQLSTLYRATLYYRPDPRLLLNVSGGWEENNYSLVTLSNRTYGGGASWTPTPLTSAEFQYERRYFGPSRIVSLQHRTRLTAWTLAYTRNSTNYQQALLALPPGNTAALLDAIFRGSIPDPVARQAAVAQFLQVTGIPAFLSNSISFYTQQVFLQERLDASVAILGKRTSVIFNAFRGKNRALSGSFNSAVPDAFSLAQGREITQHGFGVSVSRQISGTTSLGASATRTYAHQDLPATLDSLNDFYSVHLNKTLSPKTNAFAGLGYSQFKSTSDAASASSNSRSVFAGLNHRF